MDRCLQECLLMSNEKGAGVPPVNYYFCFTTDAKIVSIPIMMIVPKNMVI